MADSISDADKIRNKRLAKLGSLAQSQAASPQQDEGSSQNKGSSGEAPRASSSQQQAPPPESAAASYASTSTAKPNTLSQQGVQKASTSASRSPSASTTRAQSPSLKRPRPAPSPAKSTDNEPLDVWEDATLSKVFRVSLDPGKKQDYLGHRLEFVQQVRAELEEEKAPLKLNTSLLDQTILEAASAQKRQSPLDYLLGCWKRVSTEFRKVKTKTNTDRIEVVKEARRLCMSYCIFAITIPDMFGQDAPTTSPLVSHLLVNQEDDRGLCHDFLTEITSRFEEDDSAKEAMVAAVEDLSAQLGKMSMNSDFKPYMLAMRNLVRYPALVNAMVQSPRFLPDDVPAANIGADTLMGPFFQISPLQSDVTTTFFSSPKTKTRGDIVNAQNSLRMALHTHQSELLDITNLIIKTSKEARERMLDWMARCVNVNHKRRAMQVDQRTVSPDGFMINLTITLDQLCEPFMDATFSKIDRIDVDYLRRKPRVDIKDETKLNVDQNRSDAFYDVEVSGQSNFISEVFFLTLAAHHYGTEAASQSMSELEKEIKHMERQYAALEAERPKWATVPARLQMFERAIQKYKDKIDESLSYKYAVQGVLLDDQNQARSMQFMRYVIVWLLRVVDPSHSFPKTSLKVPLPDDQPEVFACLPEYYLEDVIGNFKFITRAMPQIITSTQSDELVTLCITFLRSSEYIKNPYLKAGLVTIMYYGTHEVYGKTKGVLGDLLNSLPFATEHLLHSLMKFYIEAEHTGAPGAFYSKFNIRYEIFQVIKCIWSNTVYQDHLSVEAKVNLEFFVRFVNLLLNDVTFVLDESLSAFKKIHELQEQLDKETDMDAQVRTEKSEALADAQGKAKSYMQLTNETVAMLKLFTKALADSFTMPEVVQRLADMLDYNLDAMAGPKSNNLRVQNPAEYGFNPKALLAEIVDVYLNLGAKDSFILAIARDGRSYKPETFQKATNLMQRFVLKSPDEIKRWNSLGERVKKAKEMDDQAEEDMGEVPDEFLDPLMFTLMEDPVILPSSRNTIDRSTIRSHLLSDPNDPFNRVPLKIEDVVDDVELKAKIQAFKAEKKGQRNPSSDAMDTSS